MTGLQQQVVLRSQSEHLRDFRQKLALTGYGDERSGLFGDPDLVFGIQSGQPDNFAPTSFDSGHALDCGGVDAPDGAVEHNTTEDFDARDFFAHEPGECCRGLSVILENEAAHSMLLGEPGQFDSVDGSGDIIGGAMGVKINDSVETRLAEGLGGRSEKGQDNEAEPIFAHMERLSDGTGRINAGRLRLDEI